MRLLLEHDRCAIFAGDSAKLGEVLAENSIDAVVMDPPAGIKFMGKTWDSARGGRDGWGAWLAGLLRPVVRAMKPGAHALTWAIPRTSHWTMCAIEEAGLEIRDVVHDMLPADEQLDAFLASLGDEQATALLRLVECGSAPPIFYQLFGQGFPKSLDISKAIDESLGKTTDRIVTGRGASACEFLDRGEPCQGHGVETSQSSRTIHTLPTAAATPEAAQWQGWGTALKPAAEHWILARKPLEGTYAENVRKWGVGALNVDACRIGTEGEVIPGTASDPQARTGEAGVDNQFGFSKYSDADKMRAAQALSIARANALGRWPAHVTLRHGPRCALEGWDLDVRASSGGGEREPSPGFSMSYHGPTRTEVLAERWRCAEGCPAAELDAQSGGATGSHGRAADQPPSPPSLVYNDPIPARGAVARSKGGAARFYYQAKPSKRETELGLDHLPVKSGGEATDREDGTAGLNSPRAGAGRRGGRRNVHPTKKSVDLMRWLCRLVTPPGGVVLDPFAGSGSTGVAALAEGFSFVGCELGGDEGGKVGEYLPILVGRIRHALGLPPEPAEETLARAGVEKRE